MNLWMPDSVNDSNLKEEYIRNLGNIFGFDITDRIEIRSDVNQFKAKEDPSVWLQAKKNAPHYHEVYWDGVWICDFDDSQDKRAVRLIFLKGFKDKYEKGEIYVNSPQERTQAVVEDAAQKAIDAMKVESQEDQIVKDTLQQVHDEKKSKKKIKKLSDI